MRAKAHGAMLRIIDDRQAALAAWCRDAHGDRSWRARPTPPPVLAFWDATSGPADARVTALAQWVRDGSLDPATRNALENTGRTMRARTRDVIGEWAALLTDREALGAGFARHAPGAASSGPARRHPPLVRRARSPAHGRDAATSDDERFAFDAEDDALLLRIHQQQRGRLPARTARACSPTST